MRIIADYPAERLARCLKEGFIYQGEPSPYRGGKPRGTRERRSAADRLRAVPAEPRSGRQPRVRRTADEAGRSGGARGCHRPAAALSANPASVHGRGRREHGAVPVLYRSHRRTGAGRPRRQASRICEVLAIFRSKASRTKFPIRTPPPPSSAPGPLADVCAGSRARTALPAPAGAAPHGNRPSPCRSARRRCPRRRPGRRDRMLADGRQSLLTIAVNLGAEAAEIPRHRSATVCLRAPTRAALGSPTGPARAVFHRGDAGAAMNDAAVHELARRAGIAVEWRDYANKQHRVSTDNLRRILAALQLPCDTAADLAHSRRLLETPRLPPLVTATAGQPFDVPVAAGKVAGSGAAHVRGRLRCRAPGAQRAARRAAPRHRARRVITSSTFGAEQHHASRSRRPVATRSRRCTGGALVGARGASLWPAQRRRLAASATLPA